MKRGAGMLRRTLLVVLVALLLFCPGFARWYTEWLWFGEVGYRAAFWVPIVSQVAVGLAAALACSSFFPSNIRPLLRLRPCPTLIELRAAGGRAYRQIIARLRPPAVTAIAVGFIAVASGAGAALRIMVDVPSMVPSGAVRRPRPVFGLDVGVLRLHAAGVHRSIRLAVLLDVRRPAHRCGRILPRSRAAR